MLRGMSSGLHTEVSDGSGEERLSALSFGLFVRVSIGSFRLSINDQQLILISPVHLEFKQTLSSKRHLHLRE